MDKLRDVLPYVLRHFDVAYIGVCVPQIWIYCIAHRTDGALSEVALGVPLYLALSAFMLAVVLLAWKGRVTRCPAGLDGPLAVAQGAASVALAAPAVLGPAAGIPWVAPLCAAAAGAGVAWLYLRWAPFFASLDVRDAVACVFCAMAVGSALKVPIDLLPPAPAAAVLALLPAASALLVRRADRRPVPCERAPRLFHEQNPTAIPWRILAGVAVYSLVIGAVKGVPVASDPVPFAALTVVHHLSEILIALAVLWWVLVRRRLIHFSSLWKAILLFTAATLFFLPSAGPAVTPWLLLGDGIAQTLVVMLLWTMLADVAHHSEASPFVIFGSGWLAYSLPLAVGEVAGLLIGSSPASAVGIATLAYLVTVAAVLALSDTAFSQRRIFADLDAPAPAPAAFASLDAQCAALGEGHGLTAREVEVLQMIVKGRSKSYIAESLFISENTVRSHAKHIYQKLDVHSKQDVLDLLHES